jgi:hypothetical protein
MKPNVPYNSSSTVVGMFGLGLPECQLHPTTASGITPLHPNYHGVRPAL